MCSLGMILIIQPPFLISGGDYMLTDDKIKGFIFRNISVVWNSLADLTLKKIGGKVDTLFVIHFMGLVNTLFFGVAYCWLDRP